MATTIMISTRVNPAVRFLLFVFILLLLSFYERRELRDRRVYFVLLLLFTNCLSQPHGRTLAAEMPVVKAFGGRTNTVRDP